MSKRQRTVTVINQVTKTFSSVLYCFCSDIFTYLKHIGIRTFTECDKSKTRVHVLPYFCYGKNKEYL